jgi:hypothetical protein
MGTALALPHEQAMGDAVEQRVAPIDPEALARGATRAVLILNALVFIAIGVSVLTSALAIPFTVFLFLSAAAFAGWGVLLPGVDGTRYDARH